MAKRSEIRFAVGEPSGRRSTVWKIWTNKSDLYISTQMFGQDIKVSIHESGQCQWSCTDAWMRKNPAKRNTQRHIAQWKMPPADGSNAANVFRIQIPESELRRIVNEDRLANVTWLAPPPICKAVVIECYITPVCSDDPAQAGNLPCPLLRSIKLADGRWVVLLNCMGEVNGEDLEQARTQVRNQNSDLQFGPEHRIALFGIVNDTQARLLIELCPIAEDALCTTATAGRGI